jgi:hypothetical protein
MASLPERSPNAESPATHDQAATVVARLRWLKSGDAVILCNRREPNGQPCHGELGKLHKPLRPGSIPVRTVVPVADGRYIPLPLFRWTITGPRGAQSGFDREPGDVLRPRLGAPRLGRRPVPHEHTGRRIVLEVGNDGYGRPAAGRAVTGYVGLPPVAIRCPVCGTRNEVGAPDAS